MSVVYFVNRLTRLHKPLAAALGLVMALALVLAGVVQAFDTEVDLGAQEQNLLIPGTGNNTYFSELSNLADVNGDGIDDLMVGATGLIQSGPLSGGAFMFLGRPNLSGVLNPTTANVSVFGGAANDIVGHALAMGDVNGDGLADMVVGADGWNNSRGAVFVILGSRTRFNTQVDYNLADISESARPPLVIYGQAAGSRFGRALTVADINGDQIADIIASAYVASPGNRSEAGTIYVIAGSTDLNESSRTIIDLQTQSAALTIHGAEGGTASPAGQAQSLAETVLFDDAPALAPQADLGDRLGRSTAAADVNGDGLADIIAGAYGHNVGSLVDAGRTYLFYGSTGYTAASHQVIDLGASPDNYGAAFDGILANEQSGFYVAGGNINGDIYKEILIGAYLSYGYQNNEIDTGRVYMMNGGHHSGLKSLSTAASTIYGGAVGDRFGRSVTAADINHDGYEDIIVGASWADPYGRSAAGKVYVIFGEPGLPQTILMKPPAQGDAYVFGAAGGPVCSDTDSGDCSDQVGRDVSGGDLNGDGVDDLVTGAVFANTNLGQDSGAVYVIYGGVPVTYSHRIYLPISRK